MVIEIPQLKFKASIATNTTLDGNWDKMFAYFWVFFRRSIMVKILIVNER